MSSADTRESALQAAVSLENLKRDNAEIAKGVRLSGSPAEAAAFVERLRLSDLAKIPGVAETIDWTQALVALGQEELEAGVVDATLGSVLKYHEDLERVRDRGLQELIAEAKRAAGV